MATKYIVNNVTGQTITGNLTINGNVIVTGSTTNNGTGVYRALLNQTGSLVGYNTGDFGGGLIIGETYTITTGQTGDDFSNIANVQSGVINETGCVFIATGQTPTIWSNGSELTSLGDLIVDVLENTLGYDLNWYYGGFGPGVYYATQSTIPLYETVINSFPKNNVLLNSQFLNSFNVVGQGRLLQLTGGAGSGANTDDVLFIGIWDWTNDVPVTDSLYYAPVQVSIKQDLDTTPVNVYGLNTATIPGGVNLTIVMIAGPNNVGTYYGDYVYVDDINELVLALNNQSNINFLGTFSVNPDVQDGIILTMTTSLRNQFAPNNELTFEVYND
jgi:hypothetical protein